MAGGSTGFYEYLQYASHRDPCAPLLATHLDSTCKTKINGSALALFQSNFDMIFRVRASLAGASRGRSLLRELQRQATALHELAQSPMS